MNDSIIGKRIRLISMGNDPDPIPNGTMGTILSCSSVSIVVHWDNGRRLGVLPDVDQYEILD